MGRPRVTSLGTRYVVGVLREPLDDYVAALTAGLLPFSLGRLLVAMAAFGASWWIYVPIHELAHALGCWLTGGTVTRLEVAPLYGAALLQRVFPFVTVGSRYAGRLSAFDTHGRDLTYLATDFCPYLLTILIGVPLLRSVRVYTGRPLVACAMLGAALPIAYAPFIGILGDYYEMGSIVVSRLVGAVSTSIPLDRWRSDDVIALSERLFGSTGAIRPQDVAGILASLLVGTLLAFLTYACGARWARRILSSGREPRVA